MPQYSLFGRFQFYTDSLGHTYTAFVSLPKSGNDQSGHSVQCRVQNGGSSSLRGSYSAKQTVAELDIIQTFETLTEKEDL